MSRWWTIAGATAMTLLVLAAPAQAGPFPNVSGGLPVPGELPTGAGDIQSFVNDLRGDIQAFVYDEAGGNPADVLKDIEDHLKDVQGRANETLECVDIDVELSPGGEPSEPTVSSGDDGGSFWTKIDVGNAILRIYVKDCAGNLGQSQGGPGP